MEFPGERYPLFERAHGAEPVAILRVLDFDHLGAKVAHECCRHGPGEELAGVQNLQSFKRHTVAVSRIRPLSHTVPPILGNHGTTKLSDGEAAGSSYNEMGDPANPREVDVPGMQIYSSWHSRTNRGLGTDKWPD